MNDLQRKVLARLQLLQSHGPQWTTLVNILDTLVEKIQNIEKMEGPIGPQGPAGESIVGPQGPKGEDGKQGPPGFDGVDGNDGKPGPKGPKGERGPAGKDGKDGKNGRDGKDGIDGSPDSPLEIRDKLQTLTGEERLDAKYIKNIPVVTRELPSISLIPSRGGSKTLEVPGAGQDIRKLRFSGLTVTRTGDGVATVTATTPSDVNTITFVIDGGGSAITTGVKGDLEIPFACTINQATLLADASGSIVIDIWKDTYANFPPTGADTITASAKPTLSSATKAQDATLTGWTTSITAGDILRFNVDSATTVKRVTLSLKVTKT